MSDRTAILVRAGLIFVLAFMVAPLVHAAPTVNMAVNPSGGVAPYPATLTWSATSAVSCAASDGWTGTKALSGTQSVTVPAGGAKYTLTCLAADGSTTINWTTPTKNTDGSNLVDLSGFNIYRGTSATNLTSVKSGVAATATSYTDAGLASGTYFYSVSATGSPNAESVKSNPVSLVIVGSSTAASATASVQTVPMPPTNVTVKVTDLTAMELRPNAAGKLVASVLGVIPIGSVCSGETRIAAGVTYSRVDPQLVDLVAVPKVMPREAWARCG